MSEWRVPSCGPMLMAVVSVACGSGGDGGDGTAGAAGQTPMATAGTDSGSGSAGGNGGSGSATTSGSAGLGGADLGGAGATPSTGSAGEAQAGGPLDQHVHEVSDTCLYSALRIELEKGGDTAVEASIDSWIKTAAYERAGQTTFVVDTHDGDHLELSWAPPASKPDVVDFRGLFNYAAQGGSRRWLCFEGRMLDAFHYPVEHYFPFVATTAFEATSDGDCTATTVQVTVSGCVSEGYNIR